MKDSILKRSFSQMSGPSLYKLDAHRSIHDGVVSEGRELLELLLKVLSEKAAHHERNTRIAAEALVEHWETRLIAHADSEEESFYQEKVNQKPELADAVTGLKRDHELFRIIVKEIKGLMDSEGITELVIDRFKAIGVLAEIHNHEEEKYLLEE
jgi:hypothetical protein